MRISILIPSVLAVTASAATWFNSALATQPASPSAAAPVEAATYVIDPAHSSILFRIKHLDVAWNYGRFADFSGSIVLDEDPAKCSVQVEIDAASVDTFQERRNSHVAGSDFFSVQEFPKITFQSKRVALDADVYTIKGDLSFHGVSKAVTMTVTKVGERETGMQGYKAGFQGEMTIHRRDFEVNTYTDEVLSDEVHLIFAIEAGKQ